MKKEQNECCQCHKKIDKRRRNWGLHIMNKGCSVGFYLCTKCYTPEKFVKLFNETLIKFDLVSKLRE